VEFAEDVDVDVLGYAGHVAIRPAESVFRANADAVRTAAALDMAEWADSQGGVSFSTVN
jgi:hypothetical protein